MLDEKHDIFSSPLVRQGGWDLFLVLVLFFQSLRIGIHWEASFLLREEFKVLSTRKSQPYFQDKNLKTDYYGAFGVRY